MPKNILIFSDGTGQAGGLIPDEVETNVYKLFRATRCGPQSEINPLEQVAFYDPGLGSQADGGGLEISWGRWIYNLLSQATGLGLSKNVIDCYAAIIRLYEPGDRIYLFGFSRGAYTARCIGGVMSYCGIPRQGPNGTALLKDQQSSIKLAAHAVKDVYLFGNGWATANLKQARHELAQKFRETYGCADGDVANIVPYFIGVWDTVAALGASWGKIIITGLILAVVLIFIASCIELFWPNLWPSFLLDALIVVAGAVVCGFIARVHYATGLSIPWYKTLYYERWKVQFYDNVLNPRVEYAKHALSIDENRKDFGRVPWKPDAIRSNATGWFEQIWFSGIHANIGGGYPEIESRLSDITLQWMAAKASTTTFPIKIAGCSLWVFPDPSGGQHNERKSGIVPWTEGRRDIETDAPLHSSVIERFKLNGVLIFDRVQPYRPESLRNHRDVKQFYS